MNILIILLGLFGGILSGMLGIGGATLIIPGLIYFANLDQKTAQGTSLALLMLPVVFTAFINYYKHGFFHKTYALLLVLAFPIGAYIGSILAIYMDSGLLRKIFAFFLIFIALKMLFER